MKGRTVAKVLICFSAALSIAALLLLIPADRIVPFLYGKHLDEIERKRIETEWILKKYQVTGLPGEAGEWLTRGHGEAPGQQVFYSFVDWGLKHPDDFIEITEGVAPEKHEKLISLLATGIIDNLDEEEFESVFSGSDEPIINEIRESIRQQK